MCKVKIPQDIAFEELIYVILREKGIHAWDARPMFITTAHSDEDINAIIKAFKEAMDEMIALEFFQHQHPLSPTVMALLKSHRWKARDSGATNLAKRPGTFPP